MAFQAEITYRGPIEKKVKGLGVAVKAALTKAVLHWHQNILPGHFGTAAQVNAKYSGQYQKRGASYMREKSKKYGHQKMLTYSGELERNVTRGVTVVASSKQAKARLPGSQKANYRRTPNSPNVREEMVTTNQAEAQQMAVLVNDEVQKFLMSNEDVLTVKP